MGILKLAPDKFRLQIRRKSLKVDKVYGTDLEARQAQATFLSKVKATSSSLLVENAWALYVESVDFLKKKPRTQKDEKGRIKGWLAELGKLPLEAIRAEDIESYISTRLKSEPQPAPDTIRIEVAAFSALLNFCVRKKFIAANPCKGVPRPSSIRRIRRMTNEERVKLMALLGHKNNRRFRYAARLCLLVLETGARPGEWCNAKRGDVDLKKQKPVVVFRETKYRNEPRTVPLTPVAVKLITDHLADMPTDEGVDLDAYGDDCPFFPVVGKNGKLRPLQYTGALRDAKKAGLIPKSVRGHTGRHEFVSTLVEASTLDDSRIMALVGHHSPASMEVYKHVRNVQFTGQLVEVDNRVLRPQRAEAVAEALDLPLAIVESMLAQERAGPEGAKAIDLGDELLYDERFSKKLRDIAAACEASPWLRDLLLRASTDHLADMRLAKEESKDRPATLKDLESIIERTLAIPSNAVPSRRRLPGKARAALQGKHEK